MCRAQKKLVARYMQRMRLKVSVGRARSFPLGVAALR
jgi:hypothetical protein